MLNAVLEKMKKDPRIIQAIKEKQKQSRKGDFIYAAVAFALPVLYAFLAKLALTGWIICVTIGILAAAVPCLVLRRMRQKPKIFIGKIVRMKEDRKIVPRKGSGAVFGTSHKYALAEVYDLVVAVENEKGETQVIFCPPQHEIILKVGDTLLLHPDLPYPAQLSNPTKCICMHCGTMQSAENESCITCGADMYSIHTVK